MKLFGEGSLGRHGKQILQPERQERNVTVFLEEMILLSSS